ncbi:hypothetical protein MRB53_030582 [Persea americana]|uniref:Uncharacterized protein n=1 Tax=Persea americana TaxID=3435 RepID=A0ACC2KM01_PERAE|nr:hypothetical protein MRB53_030582 [Persea americana]
MRGEGALACRGGAEGCDGDGERGGREALTCEWDEFCAWREKRERRWVFALLVVVVRSAGGGRRGHGLRT